MRNLLRKATCAMFLLFLLRTAAYPQNVTVSYIADTVTIFPNPERGWVFQYNSECCDSPEKPLLGPHKQLVASEMKVLHDTCPEQPTLIHDICKIQWIDQDIPQYRLDQISADFKAVRQAGMKSILRLTYNYGKWTTEPSEKWIMRHLEQLAPIIKENADIIYFVESGTFGGCGEGCCGSVYISRRRYNDAGMRILHEQMEILPPSRMLAMRYPCYAWQWAGTPGVPCANLTEEYAFSGSEQSRLAYHDDNYAGDTLHWGFFNSKTERNWTEPQSKYAIVYGETSQPTPFCTQNGASEMKKFHFSAFHWNSNDRAYDGWAGSSKYWKKTGQYDLMSKYLGYRFRLINATFTDKLRKADKFTAEIVMANDGWARIMNPRKVEIVFRNKSTGMKYVIDIDGDGRGNRLWLPGEGETKTLVISQPLPKDIPSGKYELFLNLPDPYPSLHDRPEYSIRLANKDIWEASTGYNSLISSIMITN